MLILQGNFSLNQTWLIKMYLCLVQEGENFVSLMSSNSFRTRMHSSRMCTARSLTMGVYLSGGCTCPGEGVYLPRRGVYLPGGCTCSGRYPCPGVCTCPGVGVYLRGDTCPGTPPCEQNS